MKYLIATLFAIAIGTWIGLSLHHHPGVMAISAFGWRVDFPLWLGVLVLIVFYFVLHYTLRLLSAILHTPQFLQHFSKSFRRNQAHRLTQKGFIALALGNWAIAERTLLKGAEHADMPWLNYLGAAEAAQELGQDQRRENYLARAKACEPDTSIAVELSGARLQYQHHQYAQSLARAIALSEAAPHHPYVLKLLQELYLQLQEWDLLFVLLPKLKQYNVLPQNDYQALENRVFKEVLLKAQKNQSWSELEALWQKIPKVKRITAPLSIIYASALHQQHKAVEAEVVIRNAIKEQWDESLVLLYGHLDHPTPQKLLAIAEEWLNMHQESAALLLTLGRLCQQMQLWGKAQRYFETSIGLQPTPEAYAALGSLLERMNKPELGAQFFKKGLLLVTPSGTSTLLPVKKSDDLMT